MRDTSTPLGMNARNYLYIRPYNKKSAKRKADDKLLTKRLLLKNEVTTPELLATFSDNEKTRNFDWNTLPASFVIKPARGYAGWGILLVKKWNGTIGYKVNGDEVTITDLESHIFDIISGSYSLGGLADVAFAESRIIPSTFLKKMPYEGIPDIRIIVFSGVPVMAMLRVPTAESEGKANLSKGAIGIGIDISTGVTTTAWYRNGLIEHYPGTKIKTRGIKVPEWNDVLYQAVQTQLASKLGFAGVDIVIDKNKGPTVLEINARPGLTIQSVNQASLKTRLERVGNITPKPTVERGIKIGKSLFTEEFSEKVSSGNKANNILGLYEKVTIFDEKSGKKMDINAKVDTGAYRTSIDNSLAEKLGLEKHHETVLVKSASGVGERDTVRLGFSMKGKRINTVASIADREHLKFDIIIGRKDMKGFLVDPSDTDLIDEEFEGLTESEEPESIK